MCASVYVAINGRVAGREAIIAAFDTYFANAHSGETLRDSPWRAWRLEATADRRC